MYYKIRKRRSESYFRKQRPTLRASHRFSHIPYLRGDLHEYGFGHPSFQLNVFPQFGMTLKDFMCYHYVVLNMSDIDIINMIDRHVHIKFSRTALSRWHKQANVPVRNPHERFKLAIEKGAYSHKKVAEKIDYKHRHIDHKAVNKKRLAKLIGRNYLKSKSAPRLRELLNTQSKTRKQLAQYLDVSPHTVNAWCSGFNKIHPIYYKPLEEFLHLKRKDIFKKCYKNEVKSVS